MIGDSVKKIVLKFYCCYNLGDDLFVKVFSEHFSDCRILLLANPKCIPKCLGANVRLHPYSVVELILQKAIGMLEERHILGFSGILRKIHTNCLNRIKAHCDAFVRIGGSIFMQHTPECPEVDFSTECSPDFSFRDDVCGKGNAFVIGANLGPVYSDDYWESIEQEFAQYRHICLRDYASFCRMRTLPNVHYAPDVLFLVPMPKVEQKGEHVVISVIDISQHTNDVLVIRSYYDLLEQAIDHFRKSGVPVTLVSFCQWQGDELAIQTLLDRFPDRSGISTCCYHGEPSKILEVLAEASFIVGSRFHSIILGMSFGKPVFPILYNCKTGNYLADLDFSGRSAELKDLPHTSLEDLLYNYDKHIVADVSLHHKYAENQFRGLRIFLGTKSGKGKEYESDFV